MTARQVFEGMLIELSKVNAPSLLLEDFNYFFNKAINQYINKRYNIYDISQQTTDDLRVLKSTTVLDVTKSVESEPLKSLKNLGAGKSRLFGATYECDLPQDYLHLLNCICVYELQENYKCYNKGDDVYFAAKRLTSDAFSVIANDYYNRPLPQRPYFFIHNLNNNVIPEGSRKDGETAFDKSELTPTNSDTDITGKYEVGIKDDSQKRVTSVGGNSNFPRTIDLGTLYNEGKGGTADVVQREIGQRYGNASRVRMEIRYGHDDSVFKLKQVLVDYIKTPQHIRLTQEQMNLTADHSQIMEFPDYVCQEIINELTMLVMENIADPRLPSNTQVTQSIANPAQQQAPQQQPQQQPQRG